MMEIVQRLLTVKSIVTFILTLVFAYLAVMGGIEAKDVLSVYLIVISFYFGTQMNKGESGA